MIPTLEELKTYKKVPVPEYEKSLKWRIYLYNEWEYIGEATQLDISQNRLGILSRPPIITGKLFYKSGMAAINSVDEILAIFIYYKPQMGIFLPSCYIQSIECNNDSYVSDIIISDYYWVEKERKVPSQIERFITIIEENNENSN